MSLLCTAAVSNSLLSLCETPVAWDYLHTQTQAQTHTHISGCAPDRNKAIKEGRYGSRVERKRDEEEGNVSVIMRSPWAYVKKCVRDRLHTQAVKCERFRAVRSTERTKTTEESRERQRQIGGKKWRKRKKNTATNLEKSHSGNSQTREHYLIWAGRPTEEQGGRE